MRNFFLILTVPFLCDGCVLSISHDIRVHREKSEIRQNTLASRQKQSSFKKVWGPPTRTFSQTGDAEGHFAIRPGRIYDIWFYSDKQVTLVFDRKELIAWELGP